MAVSISAPISERKGLRNINPSDETWVKIRPLTLIEETEHGNLT